MARLDHALVEKGLVISRSQAESFIRLGKVTVDGRVVTKPERFVAPDAVVAVKSEQYVSRAGLKLASVAEKLQLSFKSKVVLDVGSSTGGFTEYALRHGAKQVIAVELGTKQLHPSLMGNPSIELHEQTDIRDIHTLSTAADIVVIDVSFVSLRDILPHVATLVSPASQVVAMCKPQFEIGDAAKNKGVIKNDTLRRKILKDFEQWVRRYFVLVAKADSDVAGDKGNQERFYLLRPLKH